MSKNIFFWFNLHSLSQYCCTFCVFYTVNEWKLPVAVGNWSQSITITIRWVALKPIARHSKYLLAVCSSRDSGGPCLFRAFFSISSRSIQVSQIDTSYTHCRYLRDTPFGESLPRAQSVLILRPLTKSLHPKQTLFSLPVPFLSPVVTCRLFSVCAAQRPL